MRISPRQILPGVIILGFIAGTMAFLAAPRTLTGNPTGPVPFVFPDQLGPYTGEDVIFCTGEQCARSYLRAELEQIAEEQAADPEEKKTAEARKAAYAKLIEENKVRNLFLEFLCRCFVVLVELEYHLPLFQKSLCHLIAIWAIVRRMILKRFLDRSYVSV